MDKYQTIFLRFIALIIDYLLLIPLLYFSSDLTATFIKNGFSPEIATFAAYTSIWTFFVSYYVLMNAFFGRTFGKMLVRVKIVDTSERKINLGQSLIRSLPQIIPIIIILGFNSHYLMTGETNQKEIQIAGAVESLLNIAVLLWTIFNIIAALSDDKYRALHDYFAGTIVIKNKV